MNTLPFHIPSPSESTLRTIFPHPDDLHDFQKSGMDPFTFLISKMALRDEHTRKALLLLRDRMEMERAVLGQELSLMHARLARLEAMAVTAEVAADATETMTTTPPHAATAATTISYL